MQEHEKYALDTMLNLTLQLVLIAAGVFGIVGGFITASEKSFQWVGILMIALGSFAASGFAGYLLHGTIIGTLNQTRTFDPRNRMVQFLGLVQAVLVLIGSIFFMFFVFQNIGTAKAESLEEALNTPYAVAVRGVLEEWDSHKLFVKRQDIEQEFNEAVKRRAATPIYAFEADPSYETTMMDRFYELGETIQATLPLSNGAKLIIVGSVVDRESQLDKMGVEPNEFFSTFRMATMVTLGAGQNAAAKEGQEFINARAIVQALDTFRSIPWPICCWDEPR